MPPFKRKEIWIILEKVHEENECFFPLGGADIQVQRNREDFGKVQEKKNDFFFARRALPFKCRK